MMVEVLDQMVGEAGDDVKELEDEVDVEVEVEEH